MKAEKFEVEVRLKTVGKFLQKHRIRSGLTQKEVAVKLKYSSPQFVSNWERGLSLPPMDHLPILSKMLNVSGEQMIDVLTEYQEQIADLQRASLAKMFAKVGRR